MVYAVRNNERFGLGIVIGICGCMGAVAGGIGAGGGATGGANGSCGL
jgi:hypothetical protein